MVQRKDSANEQAAGESRLSRLHGKCSKSQTLRFQAECFSALDEQKLNANNRMPVLEIFGFRDPHKEHNLQFFKRNLKMRNINPKKIIGAFKEAEQLDSKIHTLRQRQHGY